MLCFFVLGTAQVYKELTEEIAFYRNQTFAPSTKRTYSTHRDTYLRFCHFMNIPSVPASTHGICLYAAYLARTLKFSSIKQYLGIIGLMHKEFGLPNPLIGNWQLSSLLTGVKRVCGNDLKQKLPINFDILRGIHSQLNLTYSVDAAFWAICLVAFFGMFRKSHLLISNNGSFDPAKQLTKGDFSFIPGGVLVRVRWSKTIQFRERVVQIPLMQVPGSLFCPVSAVAGAFSFTPNIPNDSQAFQWVHSSLNIRPFTYGFFMNKLRSCLKKCGLHGMDFGSHSFRRGGASLAFQVGLPLELIKILGDWKSNAVLLYLTVPLDIRVKATTLLAQNIPQQ